MSEIAKITELVCTSKVGFEDAIRKGAEKLSQKEKDVRGMKVKNVSVRLENGKVTEWRVNLKVSSEL